MKKRFLDPMGLRATWPASLATAIAVLTPLAHAGGGNKPTLPLNDTGMTQCVVNGQFTTDCVGTGQDGEFGRDVTKPNGKDGDAGFKYQKICNSGEVAGTGNCPAKPKLGSGANKWGCTQDMVSGLIWEVKTNDGGLRDWQKVYTRWDDGRAGDASEFVAQVNAQGLCGAEDWTLPTVRQLQSLVHYGRVKPDAAVDGVWFPNTATWGDYPSFGWYWAQDVYAADTTRVWGVGFEIGDPGTGGHRDYPNAVRLVRSVPAPSGQRFVPNAAGDEVTDTTSGLIWRRCVVGQSWNGSTCTGYFYMLNWNQSLEQAASLASQSGLPWRLPNVKELSSLLDTSRSGPAIDTSAFPGATSWWSLWSATPKAGDASSAWHVDVNHESVRDWPAFSVTHSALLVRNAGK